MTYVDDFLSHYGVQGMKWKQRMQAQQDISSPKPSTLKKPKAKTAKAKKQKLVVGRTATSTLVLGPSGSRPLSSLR